MKYLSIIRFLEYCSIDYTKLNIIQIKKVISAEYSLSQNGIISISKLDYTKDSVLQEIEREDFLQRLQYHMIIWSNKALLNFLEKDVIGNNANSWYHHCDNEGFKQFVSPYISYSIDKAMHRFLRDGDIAGASYLFNFFVFVDYVDENKALASTRAFILSTLKLFRNTDKNNYKSNYSKLVIWTKRQAFLFINNLPDSLSDEREDLIIALINFTVEIQLKDRRFCLGISENLIKIINIDTQYSDNIKENHEIYKNKVGGIYRFWMFIKWGFILIFGGRVLIYIIVSLISMVSDCSGNKDKETYPDNEIPTQEYRDPDSMKTAPRSFLNRLIDRSKRKRIYRKTFDYRISYENYMDIHNKYSKMLYDTTCIFVENESLPLIKNDLYYFMVENGKYKEISSLYIFNKTSMYVRYCISDFDDNAMTFFIPPKDSSFVEVHNFGFDIITSVVDFEVVEPEKEGIVRPVLISDSLNMSPHEIQTKHIDKVIHIDNPQKIYDFKIEFDSDSIYIIGKVGRKVEWVYPKL